MPFGTLVTSLRADLTQYERDLNAAYAKAEAFAKRMERLHVKLSAPGAGGAGGFGGGAIDANFRRIEAARQAAEREQRRFAASQAAAERDNAKIGADAMRQRMADLKQQILLKRELQKSDAEEARARNADVKQQIVFRRELEKQDKQAAAEEVRNSRDAMRAKNANVRQQMILRRELDRQDKEAARDAQRAARDEMAAKQANLKQQILLKRELERLDREEQNKQRQSDRDAIRVAKAASVRAEFERSNSVIARMDKALQAMDGGSLRNMLGTVKNIARAFGIVGAFGIAGAVASIAKVGIEQNQIYQRQLTTMASILAMTTRVKDAQGTTLQGQAAHNAQLTEAARLYSMIRREAASTILTGQELFGAVSANLGLGASAGLTPEQTVSVSKQITQLAKASGLSGERQFAQETRALLTGQGLQSGTVARILGIFSKKQIEQHIQKGDLFDYIMDRVNKAEPHLKRFRASFDGVMTTLTTKAQDLSRLAFERFFEKLTGRIGDLNKALTQEKLEAWAEKISDGLIKVFDAIDNFVSGGGFQKLMDFFNFLINNGGKLVGIFLAMRGALAIGSAAGGLRDFQRQEQMLAAQRAAMVGSAATGLAGAGGAVQRAAMVGSAATGLAGAGGAAAGVGRLAMLAGGAAAGLSVLAAGLAGYGIGTGINELLQSDVPFIGTGSASAERQQAESQAALEKMRQDPRTRHGALIAGARDRVHETGAEFAEALKSGDGERIEQARKAADAAAYVQQQIEKSVKEEREKAHEEKLRFESLAAEKNERLRRQAANRERVEYGLHLAKLREDKVHEINAQAQLDLIEARKSLDLDELEGEDKLEATKKFNVLAAEIEKNRIDAIRDYRRQRLIDFQQELAEQTGLQQQALAADYAATIKNIEDKKYATDQENKLKIAATVAYHRSLRDLDDERLISEREALADATGNVLLQLDMQFARKAMEVRKEVEATKSGRAAEEEINRRFHLLQVQRIRERNQLITEQEDKARDLARRSIQMERERGETIKRFTREISDLQKQTARELRELAREQMDSQRDLVRARRQGQFDERRMGRGARTQFGNVQTAGGFSRGVFMPGTEGIEGTALALTGEAGDLLRQFGVDEEVRRQMTRQHGEQLGGAMAARQLRQLREQFAGGDLEGGLGQLEGMGIRPGRMFLEGAKDLTAKSLTNQEEGARLAEDEQREQLKQQREDAGRAVEEAQRRIQELEERQAEVTASYHETISRLRTDFNDAILKSADDMKSLNQEVTRFVEVLKASGIAIRNDFMNALRQVAGGPTTQLGAEQAAQSQGAPVYNMFFGNESIKLDAKGSEALRALADALDAQRLRTAPARK